MANLHFYVKQHRITGLKYLGVTLNNPFKYPGSGRVWKEHLVEFGNLVDTLEVHTFSDRYECRQFAFNYSREHNIVKSIEWANLRLEGGHYQYDEDHYDSNQAAREYQRRNRKVEIETPEQRTTRLEYQRQYHARKRESNPLYWKRNYEKNKQYYMDLAKRKRQIH